MRRKETQDRINNLMCVATTSESEVEAVRAFIKARRLQRVLNAGIDDDSGGVVCAEALDYTRAFSRADGSAESFHARVLRERQAIPVALPAPADICRGDFCDDDTVPVAAVEEVTAPQSPRAIAGTVHGYSTRTEWD